MDHKVFVSFSSSDKQLAEKIYDRLERHGIPSWISSRDIPPGADYQSCIVQAIQTAEVVLLVFSSHANSSVEVIKELSLASTKLVIPARIEDVIPQGAFQYQISNRQFYDLFEDFDQRLEDLCRHVKAVIDSGVAPRPASAPYTAPTRAPTRRKANKGPWIFALIALLIIGVGGLFAWRVTQQKASAPIPSAEVSMPAVAPRGEAVPSKPVTATATAAVIGAASTPAPVAAPLAAVEAPTASDDRTAIGSAAHSFVSMLDGTTGFDRFTAINNLKERIPHTLNVNEAALILNGTNSARTRAIATITPALLSGLDGKEVDTLIGPLNGFDRYTALASLVNASKLGDALSSADAVTILNNTESARSRSITLLARLLAPDMGGQSAAAILDTLNGFDRYTALSALINAGKVKDDLSSQDAKLILSNSASARARSIASLAPRLASELDGPDVASLLADMRGVTRYTALKSIVDAGKLKRGLTPEATHLIIEGMDSAKTKALQLLSGFIH